MKVLLDACIPQRLVSVFTSVDAHSAYEFGWESLVNGELLREMENAAFDVLVTIDKSIPYQQNWSERQVALVIVRVPNNRLSTLTAALTRVEVSLITAPKGQITTIE